MSRYGREKSSDFRRTKDVSGFVPNTKKRDKSKAKSVSVNRYAMELKEDNDMDTLRLKKFAELLKILDYVDKHYSQGISVDSPRFTYNSARESCNIRDSYKFGNNEENQAKLPLIKHNNGGIVGFEKDLKAKLMNIQDYKSLTQRQPVTPKEEKCKKAPDSLNSTGISLPKKPLQASKYILLPKYKLDSSPDIKSETRQSQPRSGFMRKRTRTNSKTEKKPPDELIKLNLSIGINQKKKIEKEILDESLALVGWENTD